MKRQATREGGQILILSPENGSAAALSALPSGVSSDGKGTTPEASAQGPQGESLLNGGELHTDYLMGNGETRRARGHVYDGTTRVDRPQSLDSRDDVVVGDATKVVFSNRTENEVDGEFVLIPITALIPSHAGGRRNPSHFIPEAQPKDEEVTSDARATERTRIINRFKPDLITDSSEAFKGAPVVNERGEVIQGYNRAITLTEMMGNRHGIGGMWARKAYTEYLRDNAAKFGLKPEDVKDGHVLVRRVKVNDAEAIRLGNINDSEMTSGGFRAIDGKTAVRKLIANNAVDSLLNKLFGEEIDSTINQALKQNGVEVMRWLKDVGIITEGEFASAFANGKLTAEARASVENMINEIVTRDASPKQKELWSKLSDQRQSNIFYAIMKALNIQNEDNRRAFYDSVFKALEIEERARQRKDIPEVKADKKSLVVKWYDTLKTILKQSTMFGDDANIARYTNEDYMLAAVMIANKTAMSTELRRVLSGIALTIDRSEVKDGQISFDEPKSFVEAVRDVVKEKYGYDMAPTPKVEDKRDAVFEAAEEELNRKLDEYSEALLDYEMKGEHEEAEEAVMAERDKAMLDALVDHYKQQGMDAEEAISTANNLMTTTRADVSLEATRRQRSMEGGTLHRFAESTQDFDNIRERAKAERGIVVPGLNEKEVNVVEIEPHPFSGTHPITQAKEWAKKHLVGAYQAIDSLGKKFTYTISGKKIEKYLSESAINKSDSIGIHLAVLCDLPRIISNSIEVEVHPDYNKEDGKRGQENKINSNTLVHRFYGAVLVNGETYRVKTTIFETRRRQSSTNTAYTYEVTEIELLPESNSSTMERTVRLQAGTPVRATKLLEGVEKSYDAGVKILEASVKETQKDFPSNSHSTENLSRRTLNESNRDSSEAVTARIAQLERRYGTKVELDEAMPDRGSYDMATGTVRINPRRHRSAEDAEVTFIHEVVAHKGVRKVLGNKGFDDMCKAIDSQLTNVQRSELGAKGYRNLGNRNTGAEWMAHVAEEAYKANGTLEMKSLWQRIVANVRYALRQAGFATHVTEADVRYMLHLADRRQRGKRDLSVELYNRFGKVRDVVGERLKHEAEASHDIMQDAMEDTHFARPEDIQAIDPTTRGGGNEGQRVRRENLYSSFEVLNRQRWWHRDALMEHLVDYMLPLARFQMLLKGLSSVEEARGYNRWDNPYANRERSASRTKDFIDRFRQNEMVQLNEIKLRIAEELNRAFGQDKDDTMMLTHLYLAIRSGLERQDVKVREGNDPQKDWAGLTGAIKMLGATLKSFRGHDLPEIDWEAEARALGVEVDELTLDQARNILNARWGITLEDYAAEVENRISGSTTEMWNLVRQIASQHRERIFKAGLISREVFQKLQYSDTFENLFAAHEAEYEQTHGAKPDMDAISRCNTVEDLLREGIITDSEADWFSHHLYDYYLPEKGSDSDFRYFEKKSGVDKLMGGGKGGAKLNSTVSRIHGHQNLSSDPLAQLCFDVMLGARNAYDNMWRRQLYDMVSEHDGTLAAVFTGEIGGSSEIDALEDIDAYKADQGRRRGNAARLEAMLTNDNRERIKGDVMKYAANAVPVKVDGKLCYIAFKDQRVGKCINDGRIKPGILERAVGALVRKFANFFTVINPSFWASNMFRDARAGVEYAYITGDKNYLKTIKEMSADGELKGLYRDVWRELKGEDSGNQYVHEFFTEGSRTALNQLTSADELQREFERMFKEDADGSVTTRKESLLTKSYDLLKRVGDMAELRARVLVYVTKRKNGATIEEAVHAAKETSVNFDRRGKYAPLFAIFQPFLNAAIQATRRDWRLYKTDPGKFFQYRMIHTMTRYAISVGAGYFLYNLFLDEDEQLSFDEYLEQYYSVNDFTRTSTIVMPMGHFGTIVIPDALDNRPWSLMADEAFRMMSIRLGWLKGATVSEGDLTDSGLRILGAWVDKIGFEPATKLYEHAIGGDEMASVALLTALFGGNPAVSPFVDNAFNRDFMGGRIHNLDRRKDDSLPNNYFDSARDKETLWHDIAVWLNDATRKKDSQRGYVDLCGSEVKHVADSYGICSDMFNMILGIYDGVAHSKYTDKETGELDTVKMLRDMILVKSYVRQPLEKYHTTAKRVDFRDKITKAETRYNQFKNLLNGKIDREDALAQAVSLLYTSEGEEDMLVLGIDLLDKAVKNLPDDSWQHKYLQSLKDETFRTQYDNSDAYLAAVELLGRAAYMETLDKSTVSDEPVESDQAVSIFKHNKKGLLNTFKSGSQSDFEAYAEQMANLSYDININPEDYGN